jgi:hypothetical protein
MTDETEQDETEQPEPFTIPLPPGFPPPPHAGDRVLFFRSSEEGEVGSGKAHEDIMLRRVPREVAMRYRAGAGGRGMTHAQYLTALVELHARIRERADAGDETARAALDELGLQTVNV